MKSKNSNGAGICPNCKKRFMRCPSCSELTEIALSAKNTEIIPCSHCGQTLMPSGIKEEIGNKHSPKYYKH